MKTQKRLSLTPETSEPPVSQDRYFIRYELHTYFLGTTEKIKNYHPQAPQSRQSLSVLKEDWFL